MPYNALADWLQTSGAGQGGGKSALISALGSLLGTGGAGANDPAASGAPEGTTYDAASNSFTSGLAKAWGMTGAGSAAGMTPNVSAGSVQQQAAKSGHADSY